MQRLIFILLTIIPLLGSAQKQKTLSISNKRAISRYQEALSFFDKNDNVTAARYLNECIKIEPKFIEAYLVLGQVYMEMGDFEKSIDCYEKSHQINPDFFPRSYYTLGLLYYTNGKYNEALNSYNKYLTYNDNSASLKKMALQYVEKCKFSINAINHPVPYNPINIGININTYLDEYWPSLSVDENTIVYTVKLPKSEDVGMRGTRWQEDFYYSTRNEKGEWSKGIPLPGSINTEYNEGAQSLSADGNTMFFTICRGPCNLYYSVKNANGSWATPVKLPPTINTSKYSEKQPSISPDGKTLYFVSNRSGGLGGYDIWTSDHLPDGSWSNAKNLGEPVNSNGNEQSPFIHFDNQTLYFSTNGHIGLGSQDLFVSRKGKDGKWSKPINLGYPINTYKSEEGLIVNAKGTTAYYSTDINPENGRDIFTFELYPEIRPIPTSYVTGTVKDFKTLDPVEATISLVDLESRNEVVSPTDQAKSSFLVCLPTNKRYALFANAPGYLFYSEHFDLEGYHSFDKPFRVDVLLNRISKNEIIVMRNIFFETDSYQLKPESTVELDKLVELLKQNPTLKIQISGHTDNQGTEEYNIALSENRAKSVVEYLISKGISPERLTSKGYGESMPISTNNTDEGRAQNRRTEMKILEM
ncbi:MAG TPA: OmpA family protein [Tenuifilaceae bacterium]|nr:OmpA family protein [Tenuifilaceae bacterium]